MKSCQSVYLHSCKSHKVGNGIFFWCECLSQDDRCHAAQSCFFILHGVRHMKKKSYTNTHTHTFQRVGTIELHLIVFSCVLK